MTTFKDGPADEPLARSAIVRRALTLPNGERVDVLIPCHAAVRLIDRVRHGAHPEHAGVELGHLLACATVHTDCPPELRSSPHRSDYYLQLGNLWMPTNRDKWAPGRVVVETIIDPSDRARHDRRQLLERKRRQERNAARRAAARARGNKPRHRR
jgi:hypothetical protein